MRRCNSADVDRSSAPELGGLTPSKGVETVGDQLIDKATGQPIRNVGAEYCGWKSRPLMQGEARGRERRSISL